MDIEEATGNKILRLNNGHFVPYGMEPSKFILNGEKFAVESWVDVFVTSLDYIMENDPHLFHNLMSDKVLFKDDPSRFVEPVTLKNGLTVETHFATDDIFSKIKSILQSTRWDYEIQIAL